MQTQRISRCVLLTVSAAATVLTVAGCSRPAVSDASSGVPLTLDEVSHWAYQIQDVASSGAVEALVASSYDMLVIEPTRTDKSSYDFDTAGMVTKLKDSDAGDGHHRKLVVAYLNIGQAEDWRWYWTWSAESQDVQLSSEVAFPADWPDYIVARDPDGWIGDYPVAYWNAQWQDIIIYGQNSVSASDRDYASAIDELILDGFDGVYLDWVEGFENDAVIAAAEDAGLDAAEEMVEFICDLRAYARTQDPDFIVIQQNAAALLDEYPGIADCVDAIAQEGVWFDGTAGDDWEDTAGYFKNDSGLTAEYIEYLDQYLDNGLPVFVCDYALEENASEAYSSALGRGYVPYVTRRALSRLTDTPPSGLN